MGMGMVGVMISHVSPHKDASSGGALILDHLSVHYRRHPALEGLTGTFQPGSLTAIVGPNGGGKSTLLKALMGLVPLSGGALLFEGCTRTDVAYLAQNAHVDRTFPLSVFDVVAMGLCHRQGFFSSFDKDACEKIHQALAHVGLEGYGKRLLHTLSGGQFQKVLFARLSLQNASVILLDEPFAAVDAYTIEDLIRLILEWHAQGRTLLVVSHDIDLVRAHFPQSLLLVNETLAWGPTQDVLTNDHWNQATKLFRTKEQARLTPHLQGAR